MRIPPDSEAGDRANTRAVMLQTSGKQQGEASMARLAGVDIPREKRVEVALTYIYGVGKTRAHETLAATGVNPDTRVCLLYTSPSPRDQRGSRMPSSA